MSDNDRASGRAFVQASSQQAVSPVPVGIAIALAGCESTASNNAEAGADRKLKAGDVALYATAPDGTRLWAVEGRNGRTVYFSSAGSQTSHSESCGKGCTRTIDDIVPADALHPHSENNHDH